MVMISRAKQSGRKIRRPVHTWNTVQQPWAITPFLIAPVIPGETLRNAVFQARAVSAPVKSDMLGWWLEHYVFYVKIRDLDDREGLTDMFVNPDWDHAPYGDDTANPLLYHNGRGRINWAERCLRRVTEEYFRDEGESWNAGVHTNGLPLAKANTASVFDSIMSEADYAPLTDVDLDLNADGSTTVGEMEEAKRQYELLRSMQLTEATYEDFLRSFGIRGAAVEKVEPHRPELIRYEKSWTYPANTVEVAGIRSVASWSQNFRADKDRFFAEPGFIFGVTVARSKIYLGNQSAAAVSLLDHVQTFLPAVLRDDPASSLVYVPDGTGPMATDPSGYFVDIRDLYIHGDQWVNHAGSINAMSLPSAATFDKDYIAPADIAPLFVSSTTAAETAIRQDGVGTFMIASAEAKDYTATTGAATSVSVG